ncbi:hypothetical protein [Erysipelothrix anatis]|uniref:hypothetical protein n=1 Tax=Erysipelothrix anatis TaxID=2683713 RepID=UPI00135C83A1|nr:hypothetical protein [Erysipelothrix anatis]
MTSYKHYTTQSVVEVAPDGVKTIHKHGKTFRSFKELKDYEKNEHIEKVKQQNAKEIAAYKKYYSEAKGE